MSAQAKSVRRSVAAIQAAKAVDPIVCLTAYSFPMARALDPHVDLLLVGDSLGMVLYGMDSTLGVTLEMMAAHATAVVRGSSQACVIVDMPFGSYQESPAQAFRNAGGLLAGTGAQGVKLEGGVAMAETIRFLVDRGVPVMGHVGLMPQSVNVSGFRATGRTDAEAQRVIADAHAVAEAGAFSVVLEGTLEPVARQITEALAIPTIGIGASPQCDGQILVSEDMLGLFNEFVPRFVKRYAELGDAVGKAASSYAADVRARVFPGRQNCFFPRKGR
jgi:3-methyl-2-oxobutanoate hydroxymethyltransferase